LLVVAQRSRISASKEKTTTSVIMGKSKSGRVEEEEGGE